ncbi:hypothetical protein NDU88_004376 [Pleurodeles waltl]|uniref:Uncharacterized protein n=1 Tax=Pleurodeles waltl TaxID=8319 RepID=A0AAV7M9R6_PLEWA|nr:hypothetical protein NDU88_004376 [Pleurodeles waltl]
MLMAGWGSVLCTLPWNRNRSNSTQGGDTPPIQSGVPPHKPCIPRAHLHLLGLLGRSLSSAPRRRGGRDHRPAGTQALLLASGAAARCPKSDESQAEPHPIGSPAPGAPGPGWHRDRPRPGQPAQGGDLSLVTPGVGPPTHPVIPGPILSSWAPRAGPAPQPATPQGPGPAPRQACSLFLSPPGSERNTPEWESLSPSHTRSGFSDLGPSGLAGTAAGRARALQLHPYLPQRILSSRALPVFFHPPRGQYFSFSAFLAGSGGVRRHEDPLPSPRKVLEGRFLLSGCFLSETVLELHKTRPTTRHLGSSQFAIVVTSARR